VVVGDDEVTRRHMDVELHLDDAFREFQIRSVEGRVISKKVYSLSIDDGNDSPDSRFCTQHCASRSRSPSNPYRNSYTTNRWV
jgi:hypothetical protein